VGRGYRVRRFRVCERRVRGCLRARYDSMFRQRRADLQHERSVGLIRCVRRDDADVHGRRLRQLRSGHPELRWLHVEWLRKEHRDRRKLRNVVYDGGVHDESNVFERFLHVVRRRYSRLRR